MAVFEIDVTSKAMREHQIAQKAAATTNFEDNYQVNVGQPTRLPVIVLPIGLPVYRMSNGRTQTHQWAHVTQNQLGKDFFVLGEENEVAQKAQHRILVALAKQGSDSVSPILGELEKYGQNENILITPSGVVVNGNRRLAAMRELFAKGDKNSYRFETVKCAVLSSGMTAIDLDLLETRLQMAPETKLDYSWVNEALKMKKLQDDGTGHKQIARNMNRQQRTVKKALAALDTVEIYLNDWRNEPYQYDLVEKGQQFFGDLPEVLSGLSGIELELSRSMNFAAYDSDRKGRLYSYKDVFKNHHEDLKTRLLEDMESLDTNGFMDTIEAEDESQGWKDPLPFELHPTKSERDQNSRLSSLFRTEGGKALASQAISASLNSIQNRNKGAEIGATAFRLVGDALDNLEQVDLSDANPNTYRGMQVKLDEIVKRSTKLKSKLVDIQFVKSR